MAEEKKYVVISTDDLDYILSKARMGGSAKVSMRERAFAAFELYHNGFYSGALYYEGERENYTAQEYLKKMFDYFLTTKSL